VLVLLTESPLPRLSSDESALSSAGITGGLLILNGKSVLRVRVGSAVSTVESAGDKDDWDEEVSERPRGRELGSVIP
jgi:hypothetical protein